MFVICLKDVGKWVRFIIPKARYAYPYGSILSFSKKGTPMAYFPNTNCDFGRHFGEHNIIINLTFCMWILFLIAIFFPDRLN